MCCPCLQHIVTMTEYKKEFPFPVVFAPEIPLNCTAEWLAKKHLSQFHCAGEEREPCIAEAANTLTVHCQLFCSLLLCSALMWAPCHHLYQLPLETEKYAHVTFFFNGGREAAFDLEDRQLVPSPKVATYDLQPEMSVGGVAEAVSDTPSSQN